MTIKDCLNRAAEKDPDSPALRFKRDDRWQVASFRELRERAWRVSEMLMDLGAEPGDRVAIGLENSPEWYELYHGITGIGAIAVPVDIKLRESEIAHVFRDCGVSVVFCSAGLADVIAGMDNTPHELHSVVILDSDPTRLPSDAKRMYHSYRTLYDDVSPAAEAEGRAFDRLNPEPHRPASFLYTSGTTGRPKGAVLTHHNFMSNVTAVADTLGIRTDDRFFLVLPLHHSFALTCMLLLPSYAGCSVNIAENLKTIKDDMEATSPTLLLAVPLLLEKMLARIQAGIDKKPLARRICRCGLTRLVGRKIHNELGGALRLIVSGGAPISRSTLTGWRKLGFRIIEGYGITETAPVLTVNPPEAPRIGTVGVPLKGVEIRIDNPGPDGSGEILAHGENVMQGYYNNPEETAAVLQDGWYRTGDLGRFDEKGYLIINGRKKSLIVNREGKNIYPEEIEQQVNQSPYVLECLALGYREPGEDTGERVGLIVVPDLEAFAAAEDRDSRRLSDRQIKDKLHEEVRSRMAALADSKHPRRIEIRFDEFEKTTTRKIKRHLYAINTANRQTE